MPFSALSSFIVAHAYHQFKVFDTNPRPSQFLNKILSSFKERKTNEMFKGSKFAEF